MFSKSESLAFFLLKFSFYLNLYILVNGSGKRTWLLLKYGEGFHCRCKGEGWQRDGWQTKPDNEKREGEGEQERGHQPREASVAKRPRE